MPNKPPVFKSPLHQKIKASAEKQRQKNNSFYRSKEWRELRKKVLMNEPFCRACMENGIVEIATEVDHITPISVDPAGALDYSNLQPMGHRCHSRKTALENFFGHKKSDY